MTLDAHHTIAPDQDTDQVLPATHRHIPPWDPRAVVDADASTGRAPSGGQTVERWHAASVDAWMSGAIMQLYND